MQKLMICGIRPMDKSMSDVILGSLKKLSREFPVEIIIPKAPNYQAEGRIKRADHSDVLIIDYLDII